MRPLLTIKEFRKALLFLEYRRSEFLEGDELPRFFYIQVSIIKERREERDRGVRERKEGEESYSRLLDSMGKGLLVASGLAYEY